MRYRYNRRVAGSVQQVEAVQGADAIRMGRADWHDMPEWLQQAYARGLVVFGAIQVTVVAPWLTERYVTAELGDWIVWDERAGLRVMSDQAFQQMFLAAA